MTQYTDKIQAIDTFWRWWADNQQAMEEAIASQRESIAPLEPYIKPMTQHIEAIHPELTWEIGKSASGGYELCVTGELNLALRVLAERWRVAGPEVEGWSFVAARQPTREAHLQYAGGEFNPEELMVHFELDEARERLDCVITHPAFASMDEKSYAMAAFLMTNMWFGEDDIMNWLGAVEVLPESEVTGEVRPWSDFDAAVQELKANATGETLIQMRGEAESGPIIVACNPAIKPLNHLLMDTSIEIHIPWVVTGDWTLASLDALLNSMEQEILDELGHQAIFVGRETHIDASSEIPGGMRVIYLHASGVDSTLSRVNAWAERDDHLPVEIQTVFDPDWAILNRWRF